MINEQGLLHEILWTGWKENLKNLSKHALLLGTSTTTTEAPISEDSESKLSAESIIGLLINHTPTIAIGVYGIICVFQKSKDKFKDLAKIVLLISLPYGPFASMIIAFESIEILKCAQKILGKTHSLIYPWFLPQKGDDLKLFLDLMKTIFGSCLQICYNSALLFYTQTGDIKTSQIVSIGQLFYLSFSTPLTLQPWLFEPWGRKVHGWKVWGWNVL